MAIIHAIDIIAEHWATIGEQRPRIMMSVIQQYSDSDDPRDILGVAYAFLNCGAKYRKQAIEYFEKYLASPSDLNCYHFVNEWGIYSSLAILYEKEYQFDKAIYCLEQCIAADNGSNVADFIRIGDVLVKIDTERAEQYYLTLLKETKFSHYKYQFEYALNEVREKIKRGYTYKPRKRK